MPLKLLDFFKPKSKDRLASSQVAEILSQAQSLRRDGNLVAAAAAFRSILEMDPTHWESVDAVAAIATQEGDIEGAIRLYDSLIDRKQDNPEPYYKRANAQNRLARWEMALADYDRAIALHAGHAKALCNRGTVLERLGRFEDALASYDRAIALEPNDVVSFYNRGSVLKELQHFEDALASYDKAIALKSDYAEAYVNRGHVLSELRRDAAAIESYDRAILLKPIYGEAFASRGMRLLGIGRVEEAISSYQRALALDPDGKFILGTQRHAQMHVCDWNNLESDLERIAKGVSAGRPIVMPLAALALFDSAPLNRQAAEIWVRSECPPDDSLGQMPERPGGERIRVGYFSADFRIHPVSLLTAELYERHDRSKFEIVAFALGPEANDPMRARLVRGFDRFIEVRDHSDRQVASLARQLGIDIAVDLGGFTQHSRPKIFALRAAPVQISYIGYLGTMGAPYMDYLIADPTIIPRERQQDYAEKILYLPSYQVNDSQRHIANRIFSRKELGLPQTGFVFSCFNANYKILQSTFEIWMRILKRVEGSVLFLYAENSTAAQNLRNQAHRHGIDTDRIVFGERVALEDYLARMRSMGLFLDTLPYNAGATASDALWAGLPVLTCMGQAFAGRVAASLLRAIDLPELITTSPEEYENLAVHLASNPAQLAAIRAKLEANRLTTRLFDTALFTRNLEAAFTVIHERARHHMPPDHVYPGD